MIRLSLPAALFCGVVLYAQGSGPVRGFGPGGPHGAFGFGPELHSGQVVTGAPYSATVTNQTTQTLADGNTIQNTNSAQVARDSQGRTYAQQTVQAGPLAQNGPVTVTFISDPVGGYTYVLNPNTKIAYRRILKVPPAGGTVQNRHTTNSAAIQSNSNRVTSDLGTQTINGVTAQGKSTTHTIPAGTMGNTQPIVSSSETWYSPDLQIPILATRKDPRTGVSTYSVSNITRAEPSASLFQIPSDYTVQDAAAGGRFGHR